MAANQSNQARTPDRQADDSLDDGSHGMNQSGHQGADGAQARESGDDEQHEQQGSSTPAGQSSDDMDSHGALAETRDAGGLGEEE
jgi:hypothetical protein